MAQSSTKAKPQAVTKDTTAADLKNATLESIEQGVEAAQETVADVAEQATDEFRKITESGLKFVRENPGTAVAGAVGVGILLGLALRNRS